MLRPVLALLLTSTLLLTACDSEIDGKAAAEVKELAPAPASPDKAAQPDKAAAPVDGSPMVFSNQGSTLEFVGAKVTQDHPGGFATFSGSSVVSGDQVSSAKVEIDLASVFTDSAKLTGHLQSDDFFDVAKYTKAIFSTTSIVVGGEGGTHTVTGVLDFHGVKKELSFPATIAVADGKGSVKSEFTIKRKDWGLEYPGKPDDLIKDEVLIKLDINLAPAG